MKITITLRGSLTKRFGPWKKKEFEVPDNCTCTEALKSVGIHPDAIPNFGMVVINGMKSKREDRLNPGDELKAWSKITGG